MDSPVIAFYLGGSPRGQPNSEGMSRSKKLPLVIGHRGHWKTVENTIRSFHEAIELGAQMLEFDVQLSKDGVPVVFHDYSLKRMTGKRGSVKSRTARHLATIAMAGDTRIPTLKETLQELVPRVPVNIELKYNHVHYRPLVKAVGECIRELGCERRVLVSSFLHYSLLLMNRFYPEVPTAPLYLTRWNGPPYEDDMEIWSKQPDWDTDLPFKRPALVVHHRMIDEAMAVKTKELGLTLLCYTVDDPEEMDRLIDLGIAGIITNQPEALVARLAAKSG